LAQARKSNVWACLLQIHTLRRMLSTPSTAFAVANGVPRAEKTAAQHLRAGHRPPAYVADASEKPASPGGFSGVIAAVAAAVTAAVGVSAKKQKQRGTMRMPTTVSLCGESRPSLLTAASATERLGCSRGARVEARYISKGPRNNTMAKKERKEELVFKYTKEMKGRQRDEFRLSLRSTIEKLKSMNRHRKLNHRHYRTLTIQRVSANAKLHGIRYSELMAKLKRANININRKIISQLGIYDRGVLTNIVEAAEPNWREIKQERLDAKKPKEYTVDEIDEVMIPYLENYKPDIYTDPTIRFNRKVTPYTVEYTIDIGDPEEWRDKLARTPELANFNVPDHWIENANAEQEPIPLDFYKEGPWTPVETGPIKEKAEARRLEREEALEKGQKVEPFKEGVGRDDWFKKEDQSWF